MLNILTIDVEEWYQTVLFNRNVEDNSEVSNLPEYIFKILDLLDKYNTKATFFIVGIVAKKYPEVTKIISRKGHELASHGYLHRLIYKLSKEDFFQDVKTSLDVLQRYSESKIIGYRACTWSITKDVFWAIDILKSLGFKYDSSIYPITLNAFNSDKLQRYSYQIKKDFIELPLSTFRFMKYNFPFSGGTFLRLFSLDFIRKNIIKINKLGYPAVVYFHSWEFDTDLSYVPMIPKWKRLIQYGNIETVNKKIEFLLKHFKFSSVKEVLQLK